MDGQPDYLKPAWAGNEHLNTKGLFFGLCSAHLDLTMSNGHFLWRMRAHFTKKYVLKKKTSFALQGRNCSLLQVRMDAWVVVVARTVGIVVASYNRDPRFESIYHQSYLLSTVLKRRQNKKRGAQLFKKSECSNDHDQCDLIGHFLKVLINKF